MDITASLSQLDYWVIGLYAALTVGLGVWIGAKQKTADGYFLAGRRMRWPVIGASLFASNVSSTTLVGLTGAAYGAGISVYNYEWMAAIVLVVFAVFFLPAILRSGVYTLPEFLERRYSSAARTYFALLTLFLNIVVDTAGSLFAGAVIFKLIWPELAYWQIIVVLAFAAGAYVIVGGLVAVMATDVLQGVILVIASCVIAVSAFDAAGGWSYVMGAAPAEKLSLIRPLGDPDMPWLGLALGVPVIGFYFWCTNQFMTQRVLAAKNEHEGRWGVLFAGLLKLPLLFVVVLPGAAALALYPDLDHADFAYPALVFDLLPAGLLGLALAGFVAALMSQIDSTLNSASTIVTMDFVRRWAPALTSLQLMRVGRGATLVFMVLAVVWAPQIARFPSLFNYLQSVLAYAVGPVVALFVVGVFSPRANARGANAAILVGVATAALLFILNFNLFGASSWGGGFKLHFLYVAPLVTGVSAAALILGSLSAPPPDADKTQGLIWSPSVFEEETRGLSAMPWWANYRIQSVSLIALTICVVIAWR
ncbi:MAG: sodium:solute symporter [Pseudomonadota bacterium]